MADKGKILLLLLLLAISGNGWTQPIPWTVQVTGSNHTLFVNADTQPSYQGQPLEIGDVIGVFYDSVGTLKCAGLLEWSQGNGYITAYGNFAGVKGFADQERLKFKIWKKALNCTIDSVLVIFEPADGALITATDLYTEGGISQVASLKGIAASITYPKLRYCNNDTQQAPSLVGKIEGLSFTAPEGLNIDRNTGLIDPSKSLPGSYNVIYQTSSCLSNASATINIVSAPIIKLGNDTAICQGTQLMLKPQDQGSDILWSTGAQTPYLTVSYAGTYQVQVTNSDLCTARDTIKVSTYDLDLKQLQKQVIPIDCKRQGQLIVEEGSIMQGKGPYLYTLTDLQTHKIIKSDVPAILLNDGSYSLTITDRSGCSKTYPTMVQISSIDNCDHPILAPNSSGALSSFFIPYSGIVKIYDKMGNCLKQLRAPAQWDGKDESGVQVPMGEYYLVSDGQESITITVIR